AATELTGAEAREVEAAARRRRTHADVGRLPDVPVAGPGGVDLEAVGKPCLLDLLPEDGLGEGAPADVPEADEEHPDGPRGYERGARRRRRQRCAPGGGRGRHAVGAEGGGTKGRADKYPASARRHLRLRPLSCGFNRR